MPDPRKPLLRVLAGERVDPPPVWLMRQAGRYLPEYRRVRESKGGFLDLCFDPDAACEVTLQPIRRFGLDAAILFSDILVVPVGLGWTVEFREGEGPVLPPLRTADAAERLDVARVTQRIAPVYETVRRVRAALPEDVALIGFAGAPWTVATYLIEGGSSRDFVAAKGWAWRDPEGFAALFDCLVRATVEHLSAQIAAGAEAVQLFDSWAGALPPSLLETAVIEPTARIIAELKARHPDIPVIGFPRGAGASIARYAAATGIDAVGLDWSVPPAWADETLPAGMAVQGNLDPTALLAGGDAMRREARRIVGAWSARPHVFNLGHGVLPPTPPEHVAELVAAVRGGSPRLTA